MAVSDISFPQNGDYLSLFCFFIIPYHLLECKMVFDLFRFFFFFFFYENSLSLLPVLIQNEALLVLSRPD